MKQSNGFIKTIVKTYDLHRTTAGLILGVMLTWSFFYLSENNMGSIIILAAIIFGAIYLYCKIRTYKFFKNLEKSVPSGDHVAVIFVKYKSAFKNAAYLHTKENKIKSILYSKGILAANYIIKTSKELESLLMNKHIRATIICGHGSRHILKLNEGRYVYCDFLGKKTHVKYVVQLHCNNGEGKPLCEFIGCSGFDTKNYTHTRDVDQYISSSNFIRSMRNAFK